MDLVVVVDAFTFMYCNGEAPTDITWLLRVLVMCMCACARLTLRWLSELLPDQRST